MVEKLKQQLLKLQTWSKVRLKEPKQGLVLFRQYPEIFKSK